MTNLANRAQELLPSGWKEILRPIRDGLKDRLPSKPQPPPDPKARRRQRALDALKGFAYFEDFDELEEWKAEDVDPLQRSNTPLLQRCEPRDGLRMKSKILLVHDYAGNYHDYESTLEETPIEQGYSCQYLQCVESFVYFSHKLVCIPPPSWTNTLHRNGVKSLGTFLIEPQTPMIERLLAHKGESDDGDPVFVFAQQLADMARIYGFDGWLLNIEKPFPAKSWDTFLFLSFIEQLREELGPAGQLVWYDALTVDNKRDYQNALTMKNLSFAQAAGSILINYQWSEKELDSSKIIASRSQVPVSNIYFGIDVWAQNKQSGSHRRVTYPAKGGGGTNTGVAVAKLAEEGLSAGIFGPAWSFEHFPGYGSNVERAMWEGTPLPQEIRCGCGDASLHTNGLYGTHPIAKFAHEHPSCSGAFFFTDFQQAFRRCRQRTPNCPTRRTGLAVEHFHSQLSGQQVLPMLGRHESFNSPEPHTRFLHAELDLGAGDGAASEDEARLNIIISPTKHQPVGRSSDYLLLFKLDMPASSSLRLVMEYERNTQWSSGDVQVFLCLQFSHRTVRHALDPSSSSRQLAHIDYEMPNAQQDSDERLWQIGVMATLPTNSLKSKTRLVSMQRLAIFHSSYKRPQAEITALRIESHDIDGKKYYRLKWQWSEKDAQLSVADNSTTANVPRSSVTGPFSSFSIKVGQLPSFYSYASEAPLDDITVQTIREEQRAISVKGFDFLGNCIASTFGNFGQDELEWAVV